MISASATHPGLVRQNNEDYVHADDQLGIYLLADGIGGHNAGEVASALAVEKVFGALRANIHHTSVDGYFELMMHVFSMAHWEVSTKSCTDAEYAKMGTTLVVVVVREERAYIASAGDSRCYLFCGQASLDNGGLSAGDAKRFSRLTHDHTVGEMLLARGVSPGEIPKRQFNTLTQSIGCGNPPVPDFTSVGLNHGDMLLLCSDGLTDMLSDAQIEAILAVGGSSLDALAAGLIDAANARGGKDNISVVLIAFS